MPFMVRFLPRVISPLLGSKSAFISLSITMVWAPVVFAASFLSSSHRLEPLSLPGKSRLPGLNLTVTVLSPVILESVAVSEVELTPDQWSKSQPLSGVAVNSTVLPCETVTGLLLASACRYFVTAVFAFQRSAFSARYAERYGVGNLLPHGIEVYNVVWNVCKIAYLCSINIVD